MRESAVGAARPRVGVWQLSPSNLVALAVALLASLGLVVALSTVSAGAGPLVQNSVESVLTGVQSVESVHSAVATETDAPTGDRAGALGDAAESGDSDAGGEQPADPGSDPVALADAYRGQLVPLGTQPSAHSVDASLSPAYLRGIDHVPLRLLGIEG